MRHVSQDCAQPTSGVGLLDTRDILWSSARDDLAAAVTRFRSEIDHPVSELDDVQVVLDEQERVSGVNEPVACGGVLVRPGDIVGCDGDGALVVPAEVAEDVVRIAARILIDDAKGRRRLYDQLKMPHDETVAAEEMEAFYADFL